MPVLWIALLVGAVGWTVLHRWVCDDIFITFRYCDNVLAGLGPVYNAGERSEGYTHFMWFLLLTLGRALGIDAATLGRWAGIPFDIGTLLLLARLSGRLFPRRGGFHGVPLAMAGWALLQEARLFASSGLETPAFTFFLLLGFHFAFVSLRPRRGALAGWSLGIASLLRPEGLLYAGIAGVFLLRRWRDDRRLVLQYAGIGLALVAPLYAFRLLYYGWPFPNPYYAKSGGGSNWLQGIIYARLYFESYSVLLLGVLTAVPLALATLRRRSTSTGDPAAAGGLGALWFLWVSATVTLVYVLRVGGDFMFGRFFLPTTPFLLLLIEWLVAQLPYRSLRIAGLVLVAAAIVVGARIKHHWLSEKRNVRGVVDESLFYPASRLRDIRQQAGILRNCLASTRAVIMVQGGQACLAYYAKFPVAIERYGLTDPHIAHEPIRVRGRPGHEKTATAEYIYDRGVNLRINYREVRSVPVYTLFGIQGLRGEIIVYDRALMDHMKTCAGAQFLDFPLYIERTWLPNVPRELEFRLRRDWEHFQLFYFMHNPDPEGLREKIRAALAARGITDLPDHVTPPQPFQDLGTPSAP